MKQILKIALARIISSILLIGLMYLIGLVPLNVGITILWYTNLIFFLADVINKYVIDKLLSGLSIKRIIFWVKYKRVPEIEEGSCKGCVIQTDYPCKYDSDECLDRETIFAKRKYKLFLIFISLFLLLSACTTQGSLIETPYKYQPIRYW